MTDFGFDITIFISIASLIVAIWAIRISLKGNSLLVTLTKSIQTMEARNKRKNVKKGNVSEATKQRELQIKEQTEQRRSVELELKKQQQEWRKRKDVAKLIKWFLDNLGDEE